MNYNALLLLDKHHKLKKDYSSSVLNNNQFTLNKEKYNKYINIRAKNKEKFQIIEKCYSVKPYSYIVPKDIILKDIFQNSIKNYKNKVTSVYDNNICDENNINRKQILWRIKKFILDKRISNDIYIKTIYLYDLLLFKKENEGIKIKNKFAKFRTAPNILIALIALILILKFFYVENKMIRIKKLLEYFDDFDFTLKDLYEMEIISLKLIDYDLNLQTPYSFLEIFLINGIVFNDDYLQSDDNFKIYDFAKEILENIMEVSNKYFKYNYFYLCCSIISFVRDKIKINKWPKALEINFGIKFEEFNEVYKIFFKKGNEKNESNIINKNNERNFYNSDIINIQNLKSINNIINVLKIMKSADKIKKVKEKINKNDLIHNFNNENRSDNHQKSMNNNIGTNSGSVNKIKVGLKKNWNESSFKSPEKANISKFTLSSLISSLNEESIKRISSLYIKSNEKKIGENKYNIEYNKEKDKDKDTEKKQEEEKKQKQLSNSSFSDISEKEEINDLETITKFSLARSHNKYRRKNIKKDRNIQTSNKSYVNSYKSNLDSSYTYDTKGCFINIKAKNKEHKDSSLNKSHINIYNKPNFKFINNIIKERREKYITKYNEKKLNKELLNSDLATKKNIISMINSTNINQTSLEEFKFYKHKFNKIQEKKDNTRSDIIFKIKEENSDIPTCESSDPKLSLNDISIRKNYRNKKLRKEVNTIEENLKNEKESKKVIDKNIYYNKLKNTKIYCADNYCSRKIGVRKFYKQKNMEDNK